MSKPSEIPNMEREYGKPIRDIIVDALRKTEGNVTQAAALLGVPKGTMAFWMVKYRVRRIIRVA